MLALTCFFFCFFFFFFFKLSVSLEGEIDLKTFLFFYYQQATIKWLLIEPGPPQSHSMD